MENHEDVRKEKQKASTDQRQLYLQKEQYHQQNPIFKESVIEDAESKVDQYEDDEQENYLHQGASTNNNYAYVDKPNELDNNEHLEQNSNYLIGGMVSWMMPDGSPIKGQVPYSLPQDDDMRDMTMGQRNMPSLHDLLDSMTMDEKPKIIIELPPAATTEPTTTTYSSRMIQTLYGNYKIY
jgi:hypothetical protein